MFAVYLDDKLVEYTENFYYLKKNDNGIYQTCTEEVANAISLKDGTICNIPETDKINPELKNVRVEYLGKIDECLFKLKQEIDNLNNRIKELENNNRVNEGESNGT